MHLSLNHRQSGLWPWDKGSLSLCPPPFPHQVVSAGGTDGAGWPLAVTSFRHGYALLVN